MGKITGFLEFARVEESSEPVEQRLRHHREFVQGISPAEASQQGARCMDCGTPFCHHACPVNNVIPDFNDLVYRDDWRRALDVLLATNNFPEFTGRICPAPCEAACTLNINSQPVGIKSIERAIIDRGWAEGWVLPQPAAVSSGKRVAIVGSGPAGLAAAQQLARAGHAVSVFEKNELPGGLLRYGIPDFKLAKAHIDRRIAQLIAEGVVFHNRTLVGAPQAVPDGVSVVAPERLRDDFDALLLAGGAEIPRDLPVPGRELAGVHFAMDYLAQQNRINAGALPAAPIDARGKKVIVIGGGDTGSDCVGTANRQGAASVVQFELLPMPPLHEDKPLTWPYWPVKLRTSSSHQEGCEREFAIATKEFCGADDRLCGLRTVHVRRDGERFIEIAGTQKDWPADLVLLALGFTGPRSELLSQLGVATDARGNALASDAALDGYATSLPGVFAAGDLRRGQSLIVWAIREGRQAARAINRYLLGKTGAG